MTAAPAIAGPLPPLRLPESLELLRLDSVSGLVAHATLAISYCQEGRGLACLSSSWLHPCPQNRLSGSLPTDWVLPDSVADMYLNNNSFSGQLPPTLKLPSNLVHLDL